MTDLEVKKIQDFVGEDFFKKGVSYPANYLQYDHHYLDKDTCIHEFTVEADKTYDFYHVIISCLDNCITNASCTCLPFQNNNMCPHIASCLIHYQDQIFVMREEEKLLQISEGILEEFYQKPELVQNFLKKQLTLEVEIEFANHLSSSGAFIKFKIGEDKLYNLNSKMHRFLIQYVTHEEVVEFGKDFVYDPNIHFFSQIDEYIVQYLVSFNKAETYYNYQQFFLSGEELCSFLKLFVHKPFTVIPYGIVYSFFIGNPISFFLSKVEDYYELSFSNRTIHFLTDDCQYIIDNNTLYSLPLKISHFFTLMYRYELSKIIFTEEKFHLFHYGIFPLIKDYIQLDSSISDSIIYIKPQAKIYLDLEDDMILCQVKFDYQGQCISFFDTNSNVVRETILERKVIDDLLHCGFEIEDSKIYMCNLEVIGEFLQYYLVELTNKYPVFTSHKMKKIKIIKDASIRSTFHIGQSNIMKYEFDFSDIPKEEISSVLESMQENKKYYRLKSGDIIDIYQNQKLKQLSSFIHDMDISKRELEFGGGVLPKYRAIYLDSIKRDQYSIVSTNHLFDQLIEKFHSYKDVTISFSKKDRSILRDYQEIGVKWLYNIYKCGFGGILADEMGLGKSIQFIYFIKQVLKEKANAKILIVSPTALIYNWKNEFDKFGSEISYKVFAEGRTLRRKQLENSGDIQVFITTYGLVRQDYDIYFSMDFELIAIDEAQSIKNIYSQITKVIKGLHANSMFALTGTPIENSVLELFSIFDFIMPGYFSNSASFQKKYCVRDVDENSLQVLNDLNLKIKPFILRRKKSDVLSSLPDKLINNIYIDLNEEQKKLYVAQLEKTKVEFDKVLANDGFEKGNLKIFQLLSKLRQLCIDPKLVYHNYSGGSAKIESLVSIVQGIVENGHKILIFTSYKKALDIVQKELEKYHISTYVIDGSVSSKKRMKLVDQFNEDETNVFLITLKAGGTGLNLTSASVVIHLDLWWNPQVENQATDRAHRIGQKNTVEVIKLICKGTIEERILELQNKKKILSDTLIEGDDRDQNIISSLTENDIRKLLTIDYGDD